MAFTLRSLVLAVAVTSATAFAPMPVRHGAPRSVLWQRLSEIDEMCIENVAEYCLKAENALAGGECDVEEYQALVNQLRDQRAILSSHVDYVDSLLGKLQAATTPGTATPADEVKETYFAG